MLKQKKASSFELEALKRTPEGTRTPDPRFRKPTLYPAELPRLIFLTSCKYRSSIYKAKIYFKEFSIIFCLIE